MTSKPSREETRFPNPETQTSKFREEYPNTQVGVCFLLVVLSCMSHRCVCCHSIRSGRQSTPCGTILYHTSYDAEYMGASAVPIRIRRKVRSTHRTFVFYFLHPLFAVCLSSSSSSSSCRHRKHVQGTRSTYIRNRYVVRSDTWKVMAAMRSSP